MHPRGLIHVGDQSLSPADPQIYSHPLPVVQWAPRLSPVRRPVDPPARPAAALTSFPAACSTYYPAQLQDICEVGRLECDGRCIAAHHTDRGCVPDSDSNAQPGTDPPIRRPCLRSRPNNSCSRGDTGVSCLLMTRHDRAAHVDNLYPYSQARLSSVIHVVYANSQPVEMSSRVTFYIITYMHRRLFLYN